MIYLVEDDRSIRELITYTLNNSGLETKGFDRPSAFWRAIGEAKPELILLDLMLPEEDGIHILKRLRGNPATLRVPVMILSAKSSEYDKVIGLDSGADDYMSKPFGMMELLSRVKALLRRAADRAGEVKGEEYCSGMLRVDRSKHKVIVDGKEIALTLREFDILCLLMENLDMVLSRDTILTKIWGYSFDGETRTVDVHIRSLRQKLGKAGDQIETIRGIGYKISRL